MNWHCVNWRVMTAIVVLCTISGCATRPIDRTSTSSISASAATNPSVLAAAERRNQAQSAETIARADLMPEVSLNASATAYTHDNSTTTPRQLTSSIGVSVDLPISKAIAAVAGVQVAASNTKAAGEALRASKNDLLVRIARAIAGLERANNVQAARGEHLNQLNAFYKEQRARLRAGDVSKTDLEQIKGRIAFSSSEYSRAKADAMEANARLRSFTGGSPTENLILIDPQRHVPGTEIAAVKIARAENPAIREGNWRRESASQDVNVAAVGVGPEASFSVNLTGTNDLYMDDSSITSDNANVRFSLSVPIFDGGKRLANVDTKLSKFRETHYDALASTREVEANTRAFWYQAKSAMKSLKFAKQRRVAAERALRGVKEARRVGARTTQDELQAHQELTEARIFEGQAEYDTLVFGHELLAQMGRLGRAYNLKQKSQ